MSEPVSIGSVRPGSIVKIALPGVFTGSGQHLAQHQEVTVGQHLMQVVHISAPEIQITDDTLDNYVFVIIVKEAPDPLS